MTMSHNINLVSTSLPKRVTRSLAVTLTFEELDQVGVGTKVLGNSVGKLPGSIKRIYKKTVGKKVGNKNFLNLKRLVLDYQCQMSTGMYIALDYQCQMSTGMYIVLDYQCQMSTGMYILLCCGLWC